MKKKFSYKEAYEGIWNQYLLKVSGRERLEHRFNILLVISSFLALAFFTFRIWEKNIFNFIPIVSLGAVFLFSILHIFPRVLWSPWVNKNDYNEYKKNKDVEGIYNQLIDESLKLTGQIDKITKRDSEILKKSIFLLLFSTVFPLAIYFTDFTLPIIVFCIFALLMIISYLLIFPLKDKKNKK
jgi:membrane protein YdbS with pleckstrin-like domain